MNFNNSIEKIFNFKKESVMALAAVEPKRFFGAQNKPAKKRPVRPADTLRLSTLYEKVISFNSLPYEHQLYDLKNHSIELGGMRRHAYESFNLWDSESDSEAQNTCSVVYQFLSYFTFFPFINFLHTVHNYIPKKQKNKK